MNASRMMARRMTTSQKKNTTIPGMAYPATSLVLATAIGYPGRPDLLGTAGTFSAPADPAVGPTHPGGPMAGSVDGGGSSICRGPAGGWPISRASTPPANAVPCPIDALINRSYDDRDGGQPPHVHAHRKNHRSAHSFAARGIHA